MIAAYRTKSADFFIIVFAGLLAFANRAGVAADFDPYETSITEIHEAMSAGEVTSRQLVEYYLARIEAYDKQGPAINFDHHHQSTCARACG